MTAVTGERTCGGRGVGSEVGLASVFTEPPSVMSFPANFFSFFYHQKINKKRCYIYIFVPFS